MDKYFLATITLIIFSIFIVLYIRLSKMSSVSEKSSDDPSVLKADDFSLLK
jgi:preprotein translocase subunit SecG